MTLTGPFSQIITMRNLSMKGPLKDDQMEILKDAGVLVQDGKILDIGDFGDLEKKYRGAEVALIAEPMVLLPGFVDSHTHMCFGGNRSLDYAMRNAGSSYLDIAKSGGGIWSSVKMTRATDHDELLEDLVGRVTRHVHEGVTTIEIKSGYGLNHNDEIKMLQIIKRAKQLTGINLVATCLAAHIKPRDFDGDEAAYLQWILSGLLPVVKAQQLADRVDIFIEETAFTAELAGDFINNAKQLGFECTVHADQFTAGSSLVAVACGAVSADHLEASGEKEINALAASETVATVLPGASIGLGMHFAPARKLLDAGCCVAIASDWNPGSAPQGDLLMQAAILGAFEKLSSAEVFAGITFRAAWALRLTDTGTLDVGKQADMQAYPSASYYDILYNQGKLKPSKVWTRGKLVK